ncbi:VanZ family protein [Clostridium sp. UBA1056]|uniref:VanZ family protein n=1 Tax=unclassified Clostridium TaxID=2614128 RepID=UPI003216F3CA
MGIGIGKEFLFILAVPIWIVTRVVSWKLKKKNKESINREIVLNIFFIYILCLLGATLFPLNIQLGSENGYWVSINLVPVIATFKEVSNITNDPNMHNFMIMFWIRNIMGNLLLMFPLGLMLPMLWRKLQKAKNTVVFALCLSFSIECLQLFSSFIGNRGRAFDIDDILINTIGAWLGFIIYDKCIKKYFDKYKSRSQSEDNSRNAINQ